MEFNRRDFGKIAMAAVPTAAGLSIADMAWAAQSSKFDGVQIGAITYSFRGAPPPNGTGIAAVDMPAAMQRIGLSEVELMSGDAEIIAGIPQAPGRGGGGFGGGRGGSGRGGGRGLSGRGGAGAAEVTTAPNGCPSNTPSGRDSIAKSGAAPAAGRGGGRGPATLTPEQEAAQKKIADWKMAANASTWKGVKKKFNDAGVDIQILCYNMSLNTKDDEMEYAFQMARDLGVRAISCSTTVTVAKRVAPFADKYKIMWGGHGHYNIYDPEEFAKPETFAEIMTFGKYIGVNLDIGHFTQAGYDAVAYIPTIHDRITNLHLKDSMKPDKCGVAGPTQPWGQGQTPIKEMLLLMKKNKYKFPANIELEYRIPEGSDSEKETAKCLEFAKKCFA